jgi:hypothetical protein
MSFYNLVCVTVHKGPVFHAVQITTQKSDLQYTEVADKSPMNGRDGRN